jgi:hypothetical protein
MAGKTETKKYRATYNITGLTKKDIQHNEIVSLDPADAQVKDFVDAGFLVAVDETPATDSTNQNESV